MRSQANVWKAYPCCSFERWHGWLIINGYIKKVRNENVFIQFTMNIFNISMRCWNSQKWKQRMEVLHLWTFCKTKLPSPLFVSNITAELHSLAKKERTHPENYTSVRVRKTPKLMLFPVNGQHNAANPSRQKQQVLIYRTTRN